VPRSFSLLPCTRLGKSATNPFIDPAEYQAELDLVEAMFDVVFEAQRRPPSATEPAAETVTLVACTLSGMTIPASDGLAVVNRGIIGAIAERQAE